SICRPHTPLLPPFPTRRSSDLTPFDTGSFASRVTFISGNAALRAGKDAKMQILEIVAQEYKLDVNDLDIIAEQVINRKDNSKMIDRKSTRLNSSHQIISYAVFC